MSGQYILSIDQSTQSTKGMLFDTDGVLAARADIKHKQIINNRGWVEHNPNEILNNVYRVSRIVADKAGIAKENILAMGISNQRETVVVWDRVTAKPLYNAVVWQCSRAKDICREFSENSSFIKKTTGMPLSPYWPAAKLTWLLRNVPEAARYADCGRLCCGTVDSWLLYNITKERCFKTDYSNASRTQLMNLRSLQWDGKLCGIFGIPEESLPEVCMSDSLFGTTDLDGWLEKPIPVCGVLGDSHAALLAHNCRSKGEVKATYGTGSSVMMNIGKEFVESQSGLVTSLAWGLGGKVDYVLEGNLNYTGGVITWLKDNVELIKNDLECEALAIQANPLDKTYLVPAFSGLGAPYWNDDCSALITGMTRTTGKAELARAGLECIAYQITDLLVKMSEENGAQVKVLHTDGGPTVNNYLMQFQSDISGVEIWVPKIQELSGLGAAIAAGSSAGIVDTGNVYSQLENRRYSPQMDSELKEKKYSGWMKAVARAMQ